MVMNYESVAYSGWTVFTEQCCGLPREFNISLSFEDDDTPAENSMHPPLIVLKLWKQVGLDLYGLSNDLKSLLEWQIAETGQYLPYNCVLKKKDILCLLKVKKIKLSNAKASELPVDTFAKYNVDEWMVT